jgi:hypothetical protein
MSNPEISDQITGDSEVDLWGKGEDIADMEPVNTDSSAREELYIAKALEEDYIEVTLVGLEFEDAYVSVYLRPIGSVGSRGSISIKEFNSSEDAIEYGRDKINNRFFAVRYNPNIYLYYKTPFGEIYKTEINSKIKRRRLYIKENVKEFLKKVFNELTTSQHHNQISDLSVRNPINLDLNPSKDLKTGTLRLGKKTVEISNTSSVSVPKTDKNISNRIKFFVNDFNDVHTDLGDDNINWKKTYVSNVLENKKGDKICIKVPSNGREVIFPFNVSYDTESPIWSLIEKSGGDIINVRGSNVYIRPRYQIAKTYADAYSNCRYYEPIEGYHAYTDDIKLFQKENCTVDPIAVDTNYEFVLGIRKDTKETENKNANSLSKKIRTKIFG